MTAPTGEQYAITAGPARAIITERGATLRGFSYADHPYTETFDAADEPPLGCGNVLFPWPNRTAGATWIHHGVTQHLAVTEPDRGNAIHGLVRKRPWRVVDREPDTITLAIDVPAGEGWPGPLRTEVRYQVGEAGLVVTHAVENAGDDELPFGLGVHPYLQAGPVPVDECTLHLPAARRLRLDPETMVPRGEPYEVADSPYELDGSRTVGTLREQLRLDDPYTGLRHTADGPVVVQLNHQDGGVDLWASPEFTWLQVFTPQRFPGSTGALAVEPMTCPPDALNSGTDLIRLLPADRWAASWGIRPHAR